MNPKVAPTPKLFDGGGDSPIEGERMTVLIAATDSTAHSDSLDCSDSGIPRFRDCVGE
jgi:hypothetical protein